MKKINKKKKKATEEAKYSGLIITICGIILFCYLMSDGYYKDMDNTDTQEYVTVIETTGDGQMIILHEPVGGTIQESN